MKLEMQKLYVDGHIGQNAIYFKSKCLYFSIPRELILDVVRECKICAQCQPLKTKEKMKHITAEFPWERLMLDLIDMRSYKVFNDGIAGYYLFWMYIQNLPERIH